jgi:hypothetical protein
VRPLRINRMPRYSAAANEIDKSRFRIPVGFHKRRSDIAIEARTLFTMNRPLMSNAKCLKL